MKKAMAILVSVVLLFGVSTTAFAAGSGTVTGTQTQDRARDQSCQTEVCEADREQARLQVRDRIQISEEALTQYRERLQTETGACFCDTEQHWAREQIGAAYSWGLVNGYPNGDFGPNGTISGTEAVLMMSRLRNCLDTEDDADASEEEIDWSLVPAWAGEMLREESALRIAAQSQNYGEEQLNRLQFAVMLAKAMGFEAEEVSEDTVVFLDQSEIPAEDLGFVAALRTLGIIEGEDGCFCAGRVVTRAEAAAMLMRILELVE
jgi:hypothetical protein